MRTGTIQRLIDVLDSSLEKLGVTVSPGKLEDMAVTIHKAMSVEARHFHTAEHVLHLSNPENPIQSLAALFHDIVYYQVDRGFLSEVCALISLYFYEKNDEISLSQEISPDKKIFRLALDIFGFSAGQKLSPNAGLNEFLSALVMIKELGDVLPEKELVKIIAYIEATIPFRGRDAQGRSPFEILEARLRNACQFGHIPMAAAEVEDTIKGAVIFANKDVDSFAEEDPGVFLDSTWKLLPETNIALRSGEIYSIRDYRQALQKMEKFMGFVNPENIFHTYRGIPPEKDFYRMVGYARNNVDTAREFLGAKLVTMALLESLAEITGGDAPLSLFTGDARKSGGETRRLEKFLPSTEPDLAITSTAVYRILDVGIAGEPDFHDLKNSPTTLFLYKSLGIEKIKIVLAYARDFFEEKLGPQEFLAKVDGPVVAAIAKACASIVATHSEKLLEQAREAENQGGTT